VKVSELAARSGISPSAVRWYESVGALPPARRTASGYRDYGDEDVARLRLVVALRRLGVGPAEAGRLASRCLERGAAHVVPLLAGQRAEVARRRAELDRLESELLDLELTLTAAGRAGTRREPAMPRTPIRVLFVCTGNSARSQLAEALLGAIGGGDFAVLSAGTNPRGVHPLAIRVLAERGIDWSGARSKSVGEFAGQPFDYVITVCDRARQACPVFPGSYNSLHWGLDDPAEAEGDEDARLAAFRRTEMELTQRIRPFVEVARRAAGRPSPATAG